MPLSLTQYRHAHSLLVALDSHHIGSLPVFPHRLLTLPPDLLSKGINGFQRHRAQAFPPTINLCSFQCPGIFLSFLPSRVLRPSQQAGSFLPEPFAKPQGLPQPGFVTLLEMVFPLPRVQNSSSRSSSHASCSLSPVQGCRASFARASNVTFSSLRGHPQYLCSSLGGEKM